MIRYYALVQNKESGEYHIREYKERIDKNTGEVKHIPSSSKLQCGEYIDDKYTPALNMKMDDGKYHKYFGESGMRHLCADVGRRVCGQCVATLYASNDDYETRLC